jgi:multidrug transporter EmrE-like cation transporter
MTDAQAVPACSSLTGRERWCKVMYATITLAPIIGSFLFNHEFRNGGHLHLWGCPSLHWLGIPCPAWGLTRSFMAIARGELDVAIAYNLFGPVVFLGFCIATVHLLTEAVQGQKLRPMYVRLAATPGVQLLFFLLLFGYHATRLHALAQTGELSASIHQSPLGQSILLWWL